MNGVQCLTLQPRTRLPIQTMLLSPNPHFMLLLVFSLKDAEYALSKAPGPLACPPTIRASREKHSPWLTGKSHMDLSGLVHGDCNDWGCPNDVHGRLQIRTQVVQSLSKDGNRTFPATYNGLQCEVAKLRNDEIISTCHFVTWVATGRAGSYVTCLDSTTHERKSHILVIVQNSKPAPARRANILNHVL
jgi:hypothetical protein